MLFSDVRASFQWAGETINRKAAQEKITAFWEDNQLFSLRMIQNQIREM